MTWCCARTYIIGISSMKGFTLLETVVSLGILVILLTLVAGAYGHFISVQRLGVGQQEMQEDVRLFLQLFTREARTAFGNTYAILDKGEGVVFRNQEGHCVRYRVNTAAHALERAEAYPPELDHHCADPTIYPPDRVLTDEQNTVIADAHFDAISAEGAFPKRDPLTQQGLITVSLRVHSKADPTDPLHLETSVTSRQFTPYTWPQP